MSGHQSNSSERVQVHTAGPWEACILDKPLSEVPAYVEKCIAASGGKDFYFVLAADDLGPVDIAHVGNGPRAEAHARLFAAAPDLLDVARKTLSIRRADDGSYDLDALDEAINGARTAIQRATT